MFLCHLISTQLINESLSSSVTVLRGGNLGRQLDHEQYYISLQKSTSRRIYTMGRVLALALIRFLTTHQAFQAMAGNTLSTKSGVNLEPNWAYT